MSVNDYSQVPRGVGEAALGQDSAIDANKLDSGMAEELLSNDVINVKQEQEYMQAVEPSVAPEDTTTPLATDLANIEITAQQEAP